MARLAALPLAALCAWPALASAQTEAPRAFSLHGYVEAFYQYNLRAPSNGITALRGFDNRHNSFTLANAAFGASWDHRDLLGRVTLQVGHTPDSYYAAEPALPGGGAAGATSSALWKYLQQAYVGYRLGGARGVTLSAGLFLSPVGPETIPISETLHWSRANLFFGLPFYHTGLRASVPVTARWTTTVAVFNGWNSVVDNNPGKSVMAQATYTVPDRAVLSLLYFGGNERPTGAPEGSPWRHMLDTHLTLTPSPRWTVIVQANAGIERPRQGTAWWLATMLSARLRVAPRLFVAARGDVFYERVPSGAAPIFWPVAWVASGTATIDWRPHPQASLRLEYRHDHAADDAYFGGQVTGDGSPTAPFVANRRAQDTLTAGMTTWF